MPTRRPREWVPEWVEEKGGWEAWRRRVRFMLLSARARQLERLSPNQIHLIRVDGRLTAWPTLRWDWLAREGREREALPPRLSLPFDPPRRHVPTLPTNPFSERELGGGARGAGLGAAGTGAAVLALAALLLLARALERCLYRSVFKPPRRHSDEWFTPHVLATSGQTGDEQSEASGGNSEFPSEAPSGDPPPPYSECAPGAPKRRGAAPARRDEPPPPYSACYVAFSNPKDGQPTVHFFNGQRQMFDHRPNLAPETGQILAPGTGQTLAPGTGQTLAPGTSQTLASGTGQSLAPGTSQTLAPGTSQNMAPDTGAASRVGYGATTESQDASMEAGVSLECRNRVASASEETSPSRIKVA